MATTVAHGLAGVNCLLAMRLIPSNRQIPMSLSAICGFALLGNLPDFDLLIGVVTGEHPLTYHSQQTHTVAFAIVTGLVLGALMKVPPFLTASILLASAVLSHVLIDMMTGPTMGWARSYGVPLAWPLLEQRIHSPVTLFLGPHHDSWQRFFAWHNVRVVVQEILIFAPFTYWLWRLNQLPRPWALPWYTSKLTAQ